MKKTLRKILIGSLAAVTLIASSAPALAYGACRPPVKRCQYVCVPVYKWCNGCYVIVGYKSVCQVHKH